jgi:hypothetical protein
MADTHDASSPSAIRLWLRAAVILLIVVVMINVSLERGAQVAGVAVLVQALMFLRKRRVPYGWRGSPPSGHFTGTAVPVALLLCAAGLFLIFKSSVAADFFRLCCERR